MSIRSITPSSSCSAPIGISVATTCWPKALFSDSRARKKSARSRSSMFTNTMRASPSSAARSQSRLVVTSTPITPFTTNTAPSTTRRAARASAMKLGSPGVSIRLILRSSQRKVERLAEIDISRAFSSGAESDTVVPSATEPSRLMAPASNKSASFTDVFPLPRWPTKATLRILFGDSCAIGLLPSACTSDRPVSPCQAYRGPRGRAPGGLLAGARRQPGLHCRAVRRGADRQLSSREPYPLAHAAQAEADALRARVEPVPVVAHGDVDRVAVPAHPDADATRPRVPRRVGERLLDQPVDGGLSLACQPRGAAPFPRLTRVSTARPAEAALRSARVSMAASSPSSSSAAGRSSAIRRRRFTISRRVCSIASETRARPGLASRICAPRRAASAAPRGPERLVVELRAQRARASSEASIVCRRRSAATERAVATAVAALAATEAIRSCESSSNDGPRSGPTAARRRGSPSP